VYGKPAANLLKKLFNEAYIENGLYKKPEDDNYEH
jgi:hypothetical protein